MSTRTSWLGPAARALLPLVAAGLGAGAAWYVAAPPRWSPVYVYAGSAFALVAQGVFAALRRLLGGGFDRGVTLGTASVAGLALLHQQLAPAQPMVVLLVVDCLRGDELAQGTMPRLTSWLDSSWSFSNASSLSSWTRTSMPSLLSGRLPAEHGLYRTKPPDRIRSDVRMAAQYFDDAGWATAGFAEQAQLVRAFGFGRGFQLYTSKGGDAHRLGLRARAWNSVFRTTPRFLFVHYMDVHGPYTSKKRWLAKDIPPTTLRLSPSTDWRRTIKDVRAGRTTPTLADWAHLRGYYEGEVRELDDDVGSLLARWASDGTLDNAWLVVTADHGEHFGDHGAIEHMRTPWASLLHVPLLVRPPGGTDGRVFDAPVMLTDVLPTLLAANGLAVPSELYGRDLRDLADGRALAEIPGFAEERASTMQRVATWWKGWKLIIEQPLPSATPTQRKQAEPWLMKPHLYDLQADPGELHDLASAEPARAAELEGVLVAYERAVKAGMRVRDVDWDAAARSGGRWVAEDPQSEPAAVSSGTMNALETLGYLDDGG